LAALAYQHEREVLVERLYSQIQREINSCKNGHSPFKKKRYSLGDIATISSPEELCQLLEVVPDPANIEVCIIQAPH